MNEDKKVSIIIACYNAEDYIDTCIESIMKQTYQNFEILICNDASKDGSSKILAEWEKSDSRIIVLHNEKNEFAASARNKCIQRSTGDYIMIQDIDDYSFPNRIEVLVSALENSNADFVSSAVACFDTDPNVITGEIHPKHLKPTKKHFLWNLPFHHPATMFRRDCIIEVAGYRVSQETRRGQDYDMFMRLYAAGYRGINVDKVLYGFRVDAANIRRRTWDARKCEMKIRYKGFKALGMMPFAIPFVIKPVLAHVVQKVKYKNI